MNRTEALALVASVGWPFLAGACVGVLFFAGLLWTIRRGLASPFAPVWFMGSLVLRTCIVVWAFQAVGRDDWRNWLACLAGFTVTRFAVSRATRPRTEPAEAPHAA